MNTMKKYYIGVGAIALISLILVGFVLLQAVSGKADVKTQRSAEEIAGKLDQYILDKNKIPANLKEVGINDVPSTISYQKKGTDKFEFCVTYKAASSNDFGSLEQLWGGAVAGGVPAESYDYYDDSSYDKTYLNVYGSHTKGKNCQTISPYLYDNYIDESNYENNYNPSIKRVPPQSSVDLDGNGIPDEDDNRMIRELCEQENIENCPV